VAHPEALGAELFVGAVEIPLRRLLQLLAEPIVRHVGADPGVHGVGRKDRLRPHDPIAAHVRDVAAGLGIKEVEVYVCGHAPHVMVAEPTTPPSVVLGAAIASGDAATIRFAAGAALGLVHAGLALPARLSRDELRLLAWTAIRAVQPHARVVGVDEAAVEAQAQKLRRVIAPNLVDDAAAQATAVQAFDPARLAQELEIGRLRAGFAASGHLAAGLALVVAAVGKDLPDVLAGPLGKGIVSFALRL